MTSEPINRAKVTFIRSRTNTCVEVTWRVWVLCLSVFRCYIEPCGECDWLQAIRWSDNHRSAVQTKKTFKPKKVTAAWQEVGVFVGGVTSQSQPISSHLDLTSAKPPGCWSLWGQRIRHWELHAIVQHDFSNQDQQLTPRPPCPFPDHTFRLIYFHRINKSRFKDPRKSPGISTIRWRPINSSVYTELSYRATVNCSFKNTNLKSDLEKV